MTSTERQKRGPSGPRFCLSWLRYSVTGSISYVPGPFMDNLSGILGAHGLSATVLPGISSSVVGETDGELSHWRVEIAESGNVLFDYPVTVATEGPPAAPTVSEALHFLREDCLSLVRWPADEDWLGGHGRAADDVEWLSAKRGIEALSRGMEERLPLEFLGALVPGMGDHGLGSPSLV